MKLKAFIQILEIFALPEEKGHFILRNFPLTLPRRKRSFPALQLVFGQRVGPRSALFCSKALLFELFEIGRGR
jgi:hypothetical protein